MHYIGLDVASKSSFVYVNRMDAEKDRDKEIPTDKDGFRQYFGAWQKKPYMSLFEAGGHTRWIP